MREAGEKGDVTGDVTLLLRPDPERADDGRHLGASASVPHRPRVDHLAEILRRHLERLTVRDDAGQLRQLRRLIELEHELGLGIDL